MKGLTVAVIASFVSCIFFTIVSVILSCKGIMLSDTLIQYFFLTFGIELGATAAIKITKSIIAGKETDDKIKRLKENNLEIDKKVITTTSNNIYDDDSGGYYG